MKPDNLLHEGEIDGTLWKVDDTASPGVISRFIGVCFPSSGMALGVSVGSDDGVIFGAAVSMRNLRTGEKKHMHHAESTDVDDLARKASEIITKALALYSLN